MNSITIPLRYIQEKSKGKKIGEQAAIVLPTMGVSTATGLLMPSFGLMFIVPILPLICATIMSMVVSKTLTKIVKQPKDAAKKAKVPEPVSINDMKRFEKVETEAKNLLKILLYHENCFNYLRMSTIEKIENKSPWNSGINVLIFIISVVIYFLGLILCFFLLFLFIIFQSLKHCFID
mgnify:CR=1 FL=1